MMKTVTLEQLRSLGACSSQLKKFEEYFGSKFEVTEVLCVAHAHDFDWNWAAYNLLTASALTAYERVRAPARTEYQRVEALAWAEYYRVKAPVLDEYDRVTAPALAEYERVRASAWARAFLDTREGS